MRRIHSPRTETNSAARKFILKFGQYSIFHGSCHDFTTMSLLWFPFHLSLFGASLYQHSCSNHAAILGSLVKHYFSEFISLFVSHVVGSLPFLIHLQIHPVEIPIFVCVHQGGCIVCILNRIRGVPQNCLTYSQASSGASKYHHIQSLSQITQD